MTLASLERNWISATVVHNICIMSKSRCKPLDFLSNEYFWVVKIVLKGMVQTMPLLKYLSCCVFCVCLHCLVFQHIGFCILMPYFEVNLIIVWSIEIKFCWRKTPVLDYLIIHCNKTLFCLSSCAKIIEQWSYSHIESAAVYNSDVILLG